MLGGDPWPSASSSAIPAARVQRLMCAPGGRCARLGLPAEIPSCPAHAPPPLASSSILHAGGLGCVAGGSAKRVLSCVCGEGVRERCGIVLAAYSWMGGLGEGAAVSHECAPFPAFADALVRRVRKVHN